MIFSKLKSYGLAIAAGVISVLLIAVRVLTARNSSLTRKAETAQAKVEHAKAVILSDKAADEQEDAHLVEVVKEIKKGKPPKELVDPNEDW